MSTHGSANMDSSSSQVSQAGNGPLDVNRIILDVIDRIDRGYNEVMGISTGFANLDQLIHGLHDGELIVVASRPGMGKTAFVMSLVESALQHSEKAVLVYSPESPASSLIYLMLSSIGKIETWCLRSAYVTDDDWPKLTSAVNKLKDRKLSIDDDPSITLEKIRARTRQLVKERGELGLIVVDNLQMIQLDGNDRGGRSHQIAEIVCGLKALAREFKCPVVVTSHVDRNLEKRQYKRPRCFDLSDSSAIEQVADVILFIYRDEVYDWRSKYKGVAEIIVAKQRLGYTGVTRLAFVGKYSRFEDQIDGCFFETNSR